MRKLIELDIDDIKVLIADKYGIEPKDINWEYEENLPDGPDDVIFTFEGE